MKKFILILSVVLVLTLLISCDMEDDEQTMADGGTTESVKMTAVVKNVGYSIEVEVI